MCDVVLRLYEFDDIFDQVTETIGTRRLTLMDSVHAMFDKLKVEKSRMKLLEHESNALRREISEDRRRKKRSDLHPANRLNQTCGRRSLRI